MNLTRIKNISDQILLKIIIKTEQISNHKDAKKIIKEISLFKSCQIQKDSWRNSFKKSQDF